MKFNQLTGKQRQDIASAGRKATKKLSEDLGVDHRTIRKWRARLKSTVIEATPVKEKSPARVLVLDIETAPMKAFIWSMWNFNLGQSLNMQLSDWFMLTWSAKWLFEETTMSDRLTPEEVFAEDDSRITTSLWHLLEEADVVITHNGKKFDVKKINTRFLKHNIAPPMPYQTIDTLEHIKKQFSISSNKLDYVAGFLGLGGKISTGGFELWKRCMTGDEEALIQMETYNIGDVTLLEDVYLVIRPYVKPHPNMGLFILDNVSCCPSCGSTELDWQGTYKTYASVFEAFRCKHCTSVGRSRKSSIPLRSKSQLTISVP